MGYRIQLSSAGKKKNYLIYPSYLFRRDDGNWLRNLQLLVLFDFFYIRIQRPFSSGQTRDLMLVELSKLGDIQQAQLEFHEERSFFSWGEDKGVVVERVTITAADTDKS